MDLNNERILITGASGFLGTHLRAVLDARKLPYAAPSHRDYDLTRQSAVRALLASHKPSLIFHLAGLSAGILANRDRPAEFFAVNASIGVNVLHAAHHFGVKKFVTAIGSCSYPSEAPNPIREESLWMGYPQAESAPYALAKRMVLVQAQAYRRQYGFNAVVLLLGNLYGEHDNFSLTDSHVVPALIRKVIEAKRDGKDALTVWGTGAPVRDFLHASDGAAALVHAAEHHDAGELVNVASGEPVTIKQLVNTVVRLAGFTGRVEWDATKPDGQMLKAIDVTRMRAVLGFTPQVGLEEGLRRTIAWLEENYAKARK